MATRVTSEYPIGEAAEEVQRILVTGGQVRTGDVIHGYPVGPMIVRAKPTPARRDGLHVGWRIRTEGYSTLVVSLTATLDVERKHSAGTDGGAR